MNMQNLSDDGVMSVRQPDRRIHMQKMRKMLGDVHRTTVLRKEREGLIPKRRLFPDGQLAWLGSEVDAWFASSTAAPTGDQRRTELLGRIFFKQRIAEREPVSDQIEPVTQNGVRERGRRSWQEPPN